MPPPPRELGGCTKKNRSGLINTELLSGGLDLPGGNEPAQLKGINKVRNDQA